MTELVCFGSPDRFEIAARWSADAEPRERLPADSGWSTGDLRITIGHQVVTQRRFNGQVEDHLSWYLAPILEWLVANWTWLLHEEAYSWPERAGAPAAVATFTALGQSIASPDEFRHRAYTSTQSWWRRHALRAADSSALFPDLYFRRVADDIEMSWIDRQPLHAPDGFELTLSPGYATLPIDSVARPLWQFIKWGISTAKVNCAEDQDALDKLRARFTTLARTPLRELELRHIGAHLEVLLEKARKTTGLKSDVSCLKGIPAIESLDSAVLMFGGLNVDIEEGDVLRLTEFLATHKGGKDSTALASLCSDPPSTPWTPPHVEGYELADELRDQLGIEQSVAFIDIADVLTKLDVKVVEAHLKITSIRGVAIAGNDFSPAILINMASAFNFNEEGRRFTLAHELCHILFDRTRARRLSHMSGPWAPPRVEKRANAFAAMFLASTTALRSLLDDSDEHCVKAVARTVRLGYSALVEHLYNVDLIDESQRYHLRGVR